LLGIYFFLKEKYLTSAIFFSIIFFLKQTQGIIFILILLSILIRGFLAKKYNYKVILYFVFFTLLHLLFIKIFYDFDTLFESEKITFIMVSIIVLMLVYVISYIGLSIKLLFMNNDYSGLPRLIGGSMAFSSLYLIYMILTDFTINEVEPLSSENLWYLFVFNLPYFIMIFMFFTNKEKLTDKKS
jgi:hypothetical protein